MNSGAKITSNMFYSYSNSTMGGGLCIIGTFMMNGGEISGNTVYSSGSNYALGGGVYVGGGTFTMKGGEISSNATSSSSFSCGGGVYVSGGTFTMNGGEISSNTSSGYSVGFGGGVYVYGTFRKLPSSGGSTSGIIYGSDASPASKANVASNSYSGCAVHISSTQKRDTTAGVTVSLDSSILGSAGVWE